MRATSLRSLVVCLLVGAAMTVLIAWSCALWARMPGGPYTPEAGMLWNKPIPSGWPAAPLRAFHGRTSFWRIDSQTNQVTAPGMYVLFVWSSGWPWRSLEAVQAEEWMTSVARRWSRGALVLGDRVGRRLGSYNDALPLRPLPLAFAGDTMLNAAGVAVAWSAIHAARRRWRRSRGRCPACGYDLVGNTTGVCPECGKAAKP